MAEDSTGGGRCLLYVVAAVVWSFGWQYYLRGQYESAVTGLPECRWYYLHCDPGWATANGAYGTGTLFALLTIPLPIVAIVYFFRWAAVSAERREQRRQLRLAQEEEARRRNAIALIENRAVGDKGKIKREDILHRLGTATNLAKRYSLITDPERKLDVEQNISMELEGIIAKHTLEDLSELLRADHFVKIKAESMLAALAGAEIDSPDSRAFSQALANAASIVGGAGTKKR